MIREVAMEVAADALSMDTIAAALVTKTAANG